MSSSRFIKDFNPRSQIQMVRVVQNKGYSKGFDLLWSQAFDCCLGRHRHKCRKHCDTVCEELKHSLDSRAYLIITYAQDSFCILGLELCGILQ